MKKVSPFNTINTESSNKSTSEILSKAVSINDKNRKKYKLIECGLIDMLKNAFIDCSKNCCHKNYFKKIHSESSIYDPNTCYTSFIIPYSLVFKLVGLPPEDIMRGFDIADDGGKTTIIFNVMLCESKSTFHHDDFFTYLNYVEQVRNYIIQYILKDNLTITDILECGSNVEVKFFIQNYADYSLTHSLETEAIKDLPDMMLAPNKDAVLYKENRIVIDSNSSFHNLKYTEHFLNFKIKTTLFSIYYNADKDKRDLSRVLARVNNIINHKYIVLQPNSAITLNYTNHFNNKYDLNSIKDSREIISYLKNVYESFGNVFIKCGMSIDCFNMKSNIYLVINIEPAKDIFGLPDLLIKNKISDTGIFYIYGKLQNRTCQVTNVKTSMY